MAGNTKNILKWPTGKLDFSGGCLLMGVLNVTPDSFSDGGKFFDHDKAIEQGIKMAADGAAIIDVGPESTRPGAEPVTAAEQIRRAIPVIEKFAKKNKDLYKYRYDKLRSRKGGVRRRGKYHKRHHRPGG
jgi:dihydropteroate synthase